ncbi:MAG: transporter related protein [Chloroflexi bacterium]|nr:transporter related protein [Chloroflexota bacterium]
MNQLTEQSAAGAGPNVPGAMTAAQGPAVCIAEVSKTYGGRTVVDNLSLNVERGEVFALLGPNGAGKTTTIEMLEGYRSPDSGTVEVLGENPRTSRILRQRVGMMPQQSALYPQITVAEALRLFCSYYAEPADPAALSVLVGLADRADARFKVLSGGEKQRLSLALALAGHPTLVFLDEPTASMDPQARLITWDLITSLRSSGVTVVLTTHYLEEAQRLADRVAIIDHGKLVALGTPADLTGRAGGVVRFLAPPGLTADGLQSLPGCSAVLEERPGVFALRSDDPDELLIEVALWARATGVRVRDLHVDRATLEEVFLQLTSELAHQ